MIEKLKEDLANGRVVTIVGTGVSIAACGNQEVEGFKVATWTGLLEHGVKHCQDIGVMDEDDVEILSLQIQKGKTDIIINAAETISQRMKAKDDGVFRGWLENTIGKLAVKDSAILDAITSLPGVLATLNYDGLLKKFTGGDAVTWLKPHETQEVLQRVVPNAVLHLHGWYREPESVVLGLSSYLAVKDHPHSKAVLNLFTLDRTLLFVGCGDTVLDPNFSRLIEWGKEALKNVAPRHYLLCRTSEIADFQKKLAGAPWLQPLDYGADFTDLVPFLCCLVPSGSAPPSPRAVSVTPLSLDLAQYQQAMRKRYSHLKLDELDPTSHDLRTLTLTGMFIAQSARECAEFMPRVFELPKEMQRRLREAGEMEDGELDSELLEQHRRAYLDQTPRPILDVVSDSAFPRLVLLGDPGSGKSTLLQFLILTWAEKAASAVGSEPLPILIELREYGRLRAEGSAIGFLEYLDCGESVRCHFDQTQLDAWLKVRPSLFLFDGLDEIFDPTLRKEISTAIHRFADEYPLARIIVTSRIIGYQHQAWRDEDFRHFMLQELDESQIDDFLARWHHAAYEESAKGEAKCALLARAIADSAAIRQLAGNPLLLTMMAMLNRTQDLPRDRAELYEQCARLLLHQWKVDSAFDRDPELAKASLDYKDKRGLLLRVARVMQPSDNAALGNLIGEAALERALADGLKGVPNVRPERAARALIEQLRGRNFMLCSMGGQSYAFVHRTFLEYFCAVEIRERFQAEQSLTLEQLKKDIFGLWPEETWHEVLCLLAGMLAPRFVAEILQWLITQPDVGGARDHFVLAARCIGELRKGDELEIVETHIFDQLSNRANTDPNPNRRCAAVHAMARGWKGEARTFAWLKLAIRSANDSFLRSAAILELPRYWKEEPETLQILRESAKHDDEANVRLQAVRQLAQGWKDDPETMPFLKEIAHSDERGFVRQGAMEEIARRWKDVSDTLPWLKVCAQFDDDEDRRQSAVQELAHGWKCDPETLTILKARVRLDESWRVRQSALVALARGWKDDPVTILVLKAYTHPKVNWVLRESALIELSRGWKSDPDVLPLLKVCAQSDESWTVRLRMVRELARGWKDDPETLPILKARAQFDEAKRVRQIAVQEVARSWKEDHETLPILKARAQSDEDIDVRQSAVRELACGWNDDEEVQSFLESLGKLPVSPVRGIAPDRINP